MKKSLKYLRKITSLLLVILIFLSCGSIKNVKAETYTLNENGWFSDLFDLTPLTAYHVGDLSVELGSGGSYDAWCIEPDVLTHNGDVYSPSYGASGNDSTLKQVMLNYTENYQSNDLWDTDAGYYAVQLAIWGRIKGYDPVGLTIKSQTELAAKIRSLASSLYNDYTEISYDINFKYNGNTDVQESYNLSKNDDSGKITLFYDNGAWYYRSKAMSITNANYARGVSFTVSINGEGYLTDGSKDNSNKYKTLTFNNINESNVFYVVYPVSKTAGETSITVSAKYNYIDAVIWNYSSGTYGFGQRMISPTVGSTTKEYTVKFTRDAIEDKGEDTTEYTGTIKLDKVGTGVVDYTISQANGESLYNLVLGQKDLNGAYIAFYKVAADSSSASLLGKGAYRTNGSTMTVSKIPLEVNETTGYAATLVCEIETPDGYDVFDGTEVTFDEGSIYTCDKYGFNTANADADNVITREITLEDKAKTFSVSVAKKDQNGTALSGYNFGLYTTQAITVSGKTTIPAGSLVAYATTDNDGVATFNAYLPASQNYVLKEIGSGDDKTAITVNGNTSYGTEVTLDVLDKATVDGYTYNVEVVNNIAYTGSLKITKTDKKTGSKLAGATFSIASDSNIYTCTTGEDGTCTIEKVEYGTYTIQETNAPEGYILSTDTQQVVIDSETMKEVSFTNVKQANASFTIQKKITGTTSTSDKFEISVEDLNNGTGYTIESDSDNDIIDTNTTKTYSLTFTKAGEYKFKVTEKDCVRYKGATSCDANNGSWKMDENSYTVKFVVDDNMDVVSYVNDNTVVNPNIVFTNEYTVGELTIKKVDSKTKAVLSGAKFEIFKDNVSYGQKTTGDDGTVVYKDLPYGTYTVREVTAPEGYIGKAAAGNVVLDAKTKEFVVENTAKPTGSFTITKKLDGITSTSDKFEISVERTSSVENGYTETSNNTSIYEGNETKTFSFVFNQAGTYDFKITEKDCAYLDGADSCTNVNGKWNMDTSIHTVKFIVDTDMNVKTYVDNVETTKTDIAFTNEYTLGALTVKKVDGKTGEALKGAKFEVIGSDGISRGTKTTGEDGTATFESLTFDTYIVKEVEAPEGYVISEDEKTAKVNSGTTSIEFKDYAKAVGTFSVKKNVTGIESTNDVFEIFYEDLDKGAHEGAYTENNSGLTLKSGETKNYSFTFNKAGTYEFKVVEKDCIHADGAALCTSVDGKWTMDTTSYTVKFVVDEKMNITTYIDDKKVDKAVVEFTNDYALSSITINKTDSNSGAKLADAEFELFNEAGESLGTKITDATGTVQWTDLVYGKYTVKETKVPDGYIENDKVYGVELNANNKAEVLDIKNTHKLEVNLRINKTISGIDATTDRFEFTISGINEEKTVSRIGAGSINEVLTFTKAGTYEYAVSEVASDNWIVDKKDHTVSIKVNDEIKVEEILVDGVKSETASVNFANKLNIGEASISIVKKYNLADTDAKNFTSSFTIKGIDNSTVKLATINGNGTAKVSFNFDKVGTYKYQVYENKLNQEGITYDETVYDLIIEIKYENGEIKMEISQEEFEFNNNYDAGKLDVYIPITKVLNGSNSTDYKFEFQNNGETFATMKGAGTLNFYKRLGVGEFTYKITEKNTGISNMTYDTTEYTVKVKVERVGLELKSSVEYYVGDKKVDKIVFTNTYTEPKKEEKKETPVDSCTSKGTDYFWAADGTCQKKTPNTASK